MYRPITYKINCYLETNMRIRLKHLVTRDNYFSLHPQKAKWKTNAGSIFCAQWVLYLLHWEKHNLRIQHSCFAQQYHNQDIQKMNITQKRYLFVDNLPDLTKRFDALGHSAVTLYASGVLKGSVICDVCPWCTFCQEMVSFRFIFLLLYIY